MAAHAVVALKYNLENAKFDEGRFLNQWEWWDYFESTSQEFINKCTFLHQREDEDVSGWTDLTTDANSNFCRVYQTILTTQCLKSYVFHSTTAAPAQLGIYFLANLGGTSIQCCFIGCSGSK